MTKLHPELAKLAVKYDAIIDLYNLNKKTAVEAHSLIAKLSARDDFGLYWSIDSFNGRWYYISYENKKIYSNPPEMGRIDYSADALKGVENNLKKHIKYIPLKN
jgi:hypothetical protein